MKEIIFLNGKFVCFEEAMVSVLSPGFLSGYGVFETMRSYRKNIVYLEEHIQRIRVSCSLLRIKFPFATAELKIAVNKAIKRSGFQDNYIRLTLWKEDFATGNSIIVKQYHPYSVQKYTAGFRGSVCPFSKEEGSVLASIKTSSRLLYEIAFAQAQEKKFDEAILLNSRGFICEGSRSNLFFVQGKELFTPSLECGCLNGITRKVVLDLARQQNIKCYEGRFTLSDLLTAKEAFLTNSLVGVMPLAAVEDKLIGKARSGELTGFFIARYKRLLGEKLFPDRK